MNEFQYYYRYRDLVRDGKADAVQCLSCALELVSRLGKNDEFTLWCPGCQKTTTPGLGMLSKIRIAVDKNKK